MPKRIIPLTDMKMKQAHIVPLCNQAIMILKELQEYTGAVAGKISGIALQRLFLKEDKRVQGLLLGAGRNFSDHSQAKISPSRARSMAGSVHSDCRTSRHRGNETGAFAAALTLSSDFFIITK